MYGGVAQRYIMWKLEGEPFKKDGKWYIKAYHPITNLLMDVRWYTDKAHADLMPKAHIGGSATAKAQTKPFVGKTFGFADKTDTIVAIRERDLTKQEVETLFHYNWERGARWRFGMFFGGIWYAPKDEPLPQVSRANKYFSIGWPQFVEAARKNAVAVYGDKASFWQNVEV